MDHHLGVQIVLDQYNSSDLIPRANGLGLNRLIPTEASNSIFEHDLRFYKLSFNRRNYNANK